MAEVSERALIAKVERRLTSKYADIPGDQVVVAVQSAAARFEQSPIRDFVFAGSPVRWWRVAPRQG